MARLNFLYWLCTTTLLIQGQYALPSRWTSEASDVQIPFNTEGNGFDSVFAGDNANGPANSAKGSLDPFIDVPYPSWLPQHVITCRKDLINALSNARKLGAQTFTATYPKILLAIKPANLSLDVSATTSALAALRMVSLPDALARAADLLLSGLAGPHGIKQIATSYTCNNHTNANTRKSKSTIYPSAFAEDAPYDISEAVLRSAIHFPEGFTFGEKTPLILVPGTGVTGCETYSSNYAKLLEDSSYADPVFLNPPSRMLDDHQNNAEFIAYAINYISGISRGVNVTVMAHAGGNMATQWAFKYWPSTRFLVSSYVAISPEYYGTTLTKELCRLGEACPPAVLQQSLGSAFARALVSDGGHSAYVPTTVTYSMFDEHIKPPPSAELYTGLRDAHGAGLTLNPIQRVCGKHTPAGRLEQGHEGVLYNAHAVAVSKDALYFKGAANLARTEPSCYKKVARGLDAKDIVSTEALQLLAALSVNNFPSKVTEEPEIKAYAQNDLREL